VILQSFPAVQSQEDIKPAVHLTVQSENDDLVGAESSDFGDGHHGGHGSGKRPISTFERLHNRVGCKRTFSNFAWSKLNFEPIIHAMSKSVNLIFQPTLLHKLTLFSARKLKCI
jgi:hypothetical protein